ncbi:hypothetical protein [Enterococcus lactis]|uniref:hypothetical protein n=1 Tax=Enterococcus lactis TaxID=357441 RepID=UPI0024124824|nr:hypothetical protein [Enterococcus lactis]
MLKSNMQLNTRSSVNLTTHQKLTTYERQMKRLAKKIHLLIFKIRSILHLIILIQT